MKSDVTRAEQVLSVACDSIGAFISQHARDRTLSHLMRDLNAALLGGDERNRIRAAQAITHLGFPLDDHID